MRIIAGKHKGRVLKEFNIDGVRPTHDRAKEALFNILQGDIYDSRFLDLFSGTGSIGIEALSRGAREVVFVDKNKESVKLINSNLALIKENCKVVCLDAVSYLRSELKPFDIIFLDPPYKDGALEVFDAIRERELLCDGGIIIYEHSGESLGDITGYKLISERKYGIATFDFYGREL